MKGLFNNSRRCESGIIFCWKRDYSALQDDKIDQEELPLFHFYVDCPGDTRESLCNFIHCHSTSDMGRMEKYIILLKVMAN